MPLWLGLVAGGQLIPPAYALSGRPEDLARGVRSLLDHAVGKARFELPTTTGAVGGGDVAHDSAFWGARSPLEVVDRIRVPTFVVGGERDLFQRGEPLIYERLKRRTTARLLIGPWNHMQASFGGSDVEGVPELGPGLPADGVPALSRIALRWFDRYLMGRATRVRDIPPVTQYVLGAGRYETGDDWPVRTLRPRRIYLRGGRRLGADAPTAAESEQTIVQQPLSGVCTQSTSQWTMGIGGFVPCTRDNRIDEALGAAVYTTLPLRESLHLNGPILADLWITTTARDAGVTVRLTDVAPDGRSTEISAGWLAASARAVDLRRSRRVGGELLQPWHPFTQAARLPVRPGEPMRLPVEVFPTAAELPPSLLL
jgi:putative CocE/NonD family hydrolase